MSDLISRSELIEQIKKYKFGAISNDAEREYVKETILNFIEFQPTAFDIDKVVEELEEQQARYSNFADRTIYQAYSKAIKIVKNGGVTDDVCEWIQTSTAKYKTGCGYRLEEYFDTNACYCKQCGKKIKVGGNEWN